MNLSAFKNLTGNEKLKAIGDFAELIAEREDAFCSISLFQLYNFYVELYRHQHFNVIIRMRSFENTDLLDPYIQNIDIGDAIVF